MGRRILKFGKDMFSRFRYFSVIFLWQDASPPLPCGRGGTKTENDKNAQNMINTSCVITIFENFALF